jgi:hypothetical protein
VIVSVHQPQYLPGRDTGTRWQAERVFVLLDNVQFKERLAEQEQDQGPEWQWLPHARGACDSNEDRRVVSTTSELGENTGTPFVLLLAGAYYPNSRLSSSPLRLRWSASSTEYPLHGTMKRMPGLRHPPAASQFRQASEEPTKRPWRS